MVCFCFSVYEPSYLIKSPYQYRNLECKIKKLITGKKIRGSWKCYFFSLSRPLIVLLGFFYNIMIYMYSKYTLCTERQICWTHTVHVHSPSPMEMSCTVCMSSVCLGACQGSRYRACHSGVVEGVSVGWSDGLSIGYISSSAFSTMHSITGRSIVDLLLM